MELDQLFHEEEAEPRAERARAAVSCLLAGKTGAPGHVQNCHTQALWRSMAKSTRAPIEH